MPSFLSSDPAQIPNSDASIRRPSETLPSSPLLTASIEYFTPSGPLELIWLRMASASRDQIGAGNDLVDQSDPIRFLRTDNFAGENQL